jgi:hypothetical protein
VVAQGGIVQLEQEGIGGARQCEGMGVTVVLRLLFVLLLLASACLSAQGG